MEQLSCGCEGSVARCAEGLARLRKKTELFQEWERIFTGDDWGSGQHVPERYAWQKYHRAVRALVRHLRGQEDPPTGPYMVWFDSGDDGYTAHDWRLVGRAHSVEGVAKYYAAALDLVSGCKDRGAEVVVTKEVQVEVLQELQIAIRGMA